MNERYIIRAYPFLPPLKGGMEKHVASLSNAQREEGSTVINVYNCGVALDQHSVRILKSLNLKKIKPNLIRNFLFFVAFLSNRKIRSIMRINRVQVHMLGDYDSIFYLFILKKFFKVESVVFSLHSKIKRPLAFRLMRLLSNKMDVKYTTGKRECAQLRELGYSNVYHQPSGVDPIFLNNSLNPSSKLYDVVSVGSLLPIKNIKFIIQIAKSCPELKFVHVGDGGEKRSLERYMQRLGVKNLVFLGDSTKNEVLETLNASKVFLMTSYSEGTPTSMMEAIAIGLPVVSSRSNNYDDLIEDSINGFVVENFNVNVYRERLLYFVNSEERCKVARHFNYEKSKTFSWSVIAKNINNMQERLR